MTADVLRRAATKIRETAKDAPTGPWWHDSVTGEVRQEQCCPDDEDGGQVVVIGNWGPSDPALAHVALWSPDVAQLVAKILESDADATDWINEVRPGSQPPEAGDPLLTLARRILGEA